MKITYIKAATVTVPLEAPLRHAAGAHWGRFVRTIVEVETDEGITGLGEMGGGESAEGAFRQMKSYLVGHNPTNLEEMRFKIANPTASLYNDRTQILAALEFACLDIIGQKRNVPVYEILGGKFEYQNGKIKVPDKSGLGIKLNRDKLAEYAELYKRLGGYPYDQDPLRQGWSPIVPNNRWADELDARTPEIAF